MINYYAFLGLTDKATDEQIKQSYRSLAKRYHPDLHPGDAVAAKKFAQINEAMEVIGDPAKRKEYDDKCAAEKAAAARAAAARTAASQASAAHPGVGTMRPMGMSQMAGRAYAGSAAGAQAVINDAYRKGYDAGVAAVNNARNVAAETWKTSAENWQKEAGDRRRDLDEARRQIDAYRHRLDEAEANTRKLENLVRLQREKAEDARLDSKAEMAAREDIKETLEAKISELENELEKRTADYESKLSVEREARKFAEADKLRLTREVARLKEENDQLSDKLSEWEAYGESEEEDERLKAIADEWQQKVKNSKKQYKDTYYGTLGTTFWATEEELNMAYAKTLKRSKGKEDEEALKAKAEEAYKVLSNPTLRNKYNTLLGITEAEIGELREEQDEYKRTQERLDEKEEETNIASYVNELIRRTNEGDADAALTLGELYLEGESVPKDASVAVNWFTLSSDEGNVDALYHLGLCYLNGEGVDADMRHGVELIKSAASKGSALAEQFIKDVASRS